MCGVSTRRVNVLTSYNSYNSINMYTLLFTPPASSLYCMKPERPQLIAVRYRRARRII